MKKPITLACASVVLLATLTWAATGLLDAMALAKQAASDLSTCRAIAGRVVSLQSAGGAAVTEAIDQLSMQRRGEKALVSIGLPTNHLVEVASELPRSVGETAYREMPTNLVLRDVTLRQVVRFLLAMSADNSPLQARALRLSSPRDSGGDTQWTAELTLTYFTYSPNSGTTWRGFGEGNTIR